MDTKTCSTCDGRRCATCNAHLPAHFPACTAVRSWRVDGPVGSRIRTYRHMDAALGRALTDAMHGPIGTHYVVSHARTGPYVVLDRSPAGRVIVKFVVGE